MFDWTWFSVSLIPIIPTLYGTYWAFTTRKALAVSMYRNQALGTGLAGLGFTLFFAVVAYSMGGGGLPGNGVGLIILLEFMVLLLFQWVDTSIQRARRSDPLLRDTLRWSRVRFILLADIILALGSLILLVALFPPNAYNGGPPPLPIFIFQLSPIYIVGTVGLIALPRAARRSGDGILRSHLLWFGFFIFFGLFNLLVANWISGGIANQTMTIIAYFLAGLCLYKSAKSLAPLNRIAPD